MPSLAHEGNPKEDTITITGGSVLSTAQLDIDFSFFGGVPNIPNIPNAADDTRSLSSSSCDQTSPSQISGRPTGGWQFDVGTKNNDDEEMTVLSGLGVYGKCCVRVCCPLPWGTDISDEGGYIDIPCVNTAYCYIDYDGIVAAYPTTGVLFSLLGSTKDSVTGVGFVINELSGRLEVYTFAAQALTLNESVANALEQTVPTLATSVALPANRVGRWFFQTDFFADPQGMFFAGGPPYVYAEKDSDIIMDSTVTAPYASGAAALAAVGTQGIHVCVFGIDIDNSAAGLGAAIWRALNTECSPCYTVSPPFNLGRDATCTQEFSD